jgi:hypothetical protein
MKKILGLFSIGGLILLACGVLLSGRMSERITAVAAAAAESEPQGRNIAPYRDFDVAILVDGRPLLEYAGRGRRYVEAQEGAEYEIRVRNPHPFRVAVALSVDGLNSIDARRTTAWNASKWVIAPYGTIHVSGWQMSSDRARRFYFTTERDSYAAKLGQTANLGAISAVFFRERRPTPVPITPPRPIPEENRDRSERSAPSAGATDSPAGSRKSKQAPILSDDEYAATGIGRSVRNDVRFIDMDLESRPINEVNIRYEYYGALVRLGILPQKYPRIDPLPRREGATGFEDRRFSPEPK